MVKYLLLVTFLVGCGSAEPTITSTNLTGIDIPESVDLQVWQQLPENDGVKDISISYMSKFRTERGIEDFEVCYQATADGTRLYGLISRVEGRWYVSISGGNAPRSGK